MTPVKWSKRFFNPRLLAVLLAALVSVGLGWEVLGEGAASRLFVRSVEGLYLGQLPAPIEPGITDPMGDLLFPATRIRLMTIKHIPRIKGGAAMPHPYVGPCTQCHLYQGGPGPGHQPKSPLGAVLESLSRVKKLGPPLPPDSQMPHPPAGRCIKCHDIVVKVPVHKKKGGARWVM